MPVSNPGRGPIRGPSSALPDPAFLSPYFLSSFSIYHTSTMASFNRGQPPAWHTKVVDDGLGPLKTGSTHLYVPVCVNDAASSKPAPVGRDVVDQRTHTNNVSCAVCICASKRCKTCTRVSEGSTFRSSVTHKTYNVVSPNPAMDCTTENVIYLITCKRCGIQYVGETSQKVRNRFNNHRNRLRQQNNLYLYQHFTSDGHCEEDISIMPIEEITGTSSVSQRARRLEREDYWCRELCTVYPYGLNDNVRKVGNVSKCGGDLVVNTLFNKQQRKYRKRPPHRHRKKVDIGNLADQVGALFSDYKSCNFCFTLRCFVLSLPKKCMVVLSTIIDNWVALHDVPERVVILVRDLIAYKSRTPHVVRNVKRTSRCSSGYLTVCYDNKGIETIGLPRILNSKSVRDTIPGFFKFHKPPMVSFSYTNTISGRIFNQKSVIKNLDFDVGTEDMCCDCSMCAYCYEPAGHVVTGDLTIIRNAKLLIENKM